MIGGRRCSKNLKFNEIDYKGTVRNCSCVIDLWQRGLRNKTGVTCTQT